MKKIICICLLVTVFGSAGTVLAATIRVGLVSGQATAEISCDSDFILSDGSENMTVPAGKYFLNAQDGALAMENVIFGRRLYISASEGKNIPQINKRSYRGRFVAIAIGNMLVLSNVVDLEQYICSVLPGKTTPVWPDEAIKAQAIAARSYVWHMKSIHSGDYYDLTANDQELLYLGIDGEKEVISGLVKATAGQILRDGNGMPALAVTTSSSGGRTESAWEAWRNDISYLRSVEDYDQDSPDYEWDYNVAPVMLQNILEQNGYEVGKLENIRLSPIDEKGSDRTSTGRVKYVIFSGDKATCRVSGDFLFEVLALNSTCFDIDTGTPAPESLKVQIENSYGMTVGSKDINIKVNDDKKPVWKNITRSYHMISGGKEEKVIFRGHGRGPGVGLSMWGARGMVNDNERISCAQILRHYYPGTYLSEI
ncbi:MAG: SpoIID/LytB domain-containing protein [Phascolarctobacterium sp.]|nr:SpoIID/LytB domain-containing protein [Phascolarctobacterium sp.]